jgi:large subunit ribosomal protein L7e
MPGFVPESVLKKRRTQDEIAAAKAAADTAGVKKAGEDKASMIKRAETYVAEYKALENDSIRLRREAKSSGSYYVPPEPKLAFVIRIRGASSRDAGGGWAFGSCTAVACTAE